jgi:hypothetical protein
LLLATEGASLQRDGLWLPPDALAVIAFEA